MTDAPPDLRELKRQVRDRIKELEPLEREAEQAAPGACGTRGQPTGAVRARRRSAAAGGKRPGRPPGSASGRRAATALRLVSERPGITVSELASAMEIGTTYLYRVMPALERDGKVRKVGTVRAGLSISRRQVWSATSDTRERRRANFGLGRHICSSCL